MPRMFAVMMMMMALAACDERVGGYDRADASYSVAGRSNCSPGAARQGKCVLKTAPVYDDVGERPMNSYAR